MGKLNKKFYLRSSLVVAKELLGKVLVHKVNGIVLSGIIVETEAYLGSKDEAAHSFRGRTKRNEKMFDEGGIAYVYFTYGNHYCVNVVTGEKDIAHAVLIRALEPVEGIASMKRSRRMKDLNNLTNGPGKLTQALKIDFKLNGANLRGDELFITEGAETKFKTGRSKRIGISKNTDKLWRFYIQGNPFVSYYNKKLR